jgi:hypothetical protein
MTTQKPRVPKGTSRRLMAQPITPVKPDDNRHSVTFYIDKDLSVQLDKAYYLRKAERPSFTRAEFREALLRDALVREGEIFANYDWAPE